MAHFVFGTRGFKEDIDRFINELSVKFLPYRGEAEIKGVFQPGTEVIQMRVCPIQLWDISFPHEHMDAVLTTIMGTEKQMHPAFEKMAWPVRKAMGLQKVPKFATDKKIVMRPLCNTEVIPIGVKEDYWTDAKTRENHSFEDRTPDSFEAI